MLIEYLKGKNWACHEHIEMTFKPGLNGILGANGTGKSSILDALRKAVTGVSIAAGSNDDNIMVGKKTASIEVGFSHGDTSYSVYRSLSPNRQKLSFPGQTITKTSEIDDYLETLLSTKLDALLNNVFVGQHALDDILFKTNTERLREFQETFGLTRLSEVYKVLTVETSNALVTPGLEVQRDLTVEAAKASRVELSAANEELNIAVLAIGTILPIVERLARHDAMSQLSVVRDRAQVVVRGLDKDIAELTTHVSRISEELEVIKTKISDGAEQAVAATTMVTTAKQEAAQRSNLAKELVRLKGTAAPTVDIDAVNSEISTLRVKVEKLKAIATGVEPLPLLPDHIELRSKITVLEADLKAAKNRNPVIQTLKRDLERETHYLKTFSDGSCPTCLRALENFDLSAQQSKVSDLTTTLAKAEADHAKLIELLDRQYIDMLGKDTERVQAAMLMFQNAHTEHNAKLVKLEAAAKASRAEAASYAAAQARLSTVQKELGAPASVSDAAFKEAEEIVRAHTILMEDLKASQGFQVTNKSKLDSLVAERTRTLGSMPKVDEDDILSDAEYNDAKAKQLELAGLTTKKREAETKVGIAEARLQVQLNSVDSLNKQIDTEAKTATWSDLCDRARNVLHVSGLPKLLMQEYATKINKRIGYYMHIWESPFRLVLDDSLSFRAVFNDGTELPAARLSGGQKIVASTSFRLAMSDTFAKNVGLLILDEPTNHLDKENIIHLQQLLVKLKQLAGASRRQMIIVTHEEQLTGFFDHTIQLVKH